MLPLPLNPLPNPSPNPRNESPKLLLAPRHALLHHAPFPQFSQTIRMKTTMRTATIPTSTAMVNAACLQHQFGPHPRPVAPAAATASKMNAWAVHASARNLMNGLSTPGAITSPPARAAGRIAQGARVFAQLAWFGRNTAGTLVKKKPTYLPRHRYDTRALKYIYICLSFCVWGFEMSR